MSERKPPGQQVSEILGFIGQGLAEGKVPDEVMEGIFKPKPQSACRKCKGPLVEVTAGDGETRVEICPTCSKGK